MKVAFPTDDQRTIAGHFGQTSGFKIYTIESGDIQSSDYRLLDHSGIENGRPGQKHKAILDLVRDCDTVITCGMGEPIYYFLQKNGITSVAQRTPEIQVVLDDFLNGKLEHDETLVHRHHHHSH